MTVNILKTKVLKVNGTVNSPITIMRLFTLSIIIIGWNLNSRRVLLSGQYHRHRWQISTSALGLARAGMHLGLYNQCGALGSSLSTPSWETLTTNVTSILLYSCETWNSTKDFNSQAIRIPDTSSAPSLCAGNGIGLDWCNNIFLYLDTDTIHMSIKCISIAFFSMLPKVRNS